MLKIVFGFIAMIVLGNLVDAQVKSVYTDLDDRKCKTLELKEDEGGSYKGECKGTGGFKIQVLEGDLRQSINIVSPDGNEHELKFWEFFYAFSAVGPRAEWRLKNNKPYSVIVRLNVSENPEDSSKTTSYLIVAKISDTSACVTDIIKPSRTQNIEARKAADASAAKPCKTSL